MRLHAFHGLAIACAAEEGATDAVSPVLASYAVPPERAGRPELTFHLAAPGSPEAERLAALPPGASPSFFSGGLQAYAYPSARGPALLLTLLDGRARARLEPDADGTFRRIDAFFPTAGTDYAAASHRVLVQIALLVALRSLRTFHLHAAALISPGGQGLLISGASGSGKTTTTLALLEAGFSHLADDSVFLRRPAGAQAGVEVLGFRRPFHVAEATARAFPRLAPLLGAPFGDTGKRDLDPERAFPGSSVDAMPSPGLLLFPRITSERATTLLPVDQADALGRLLEGSAAFAIDALPRREESLAALGELVRGARSRLELRLGADALERPSATIAPLVLGALDAR